MQGLISLSEAATRHLAGGKAAALGELLRAGFRVPNGFVVPSDSALDTVTNQAILQRFDGLDAPYVAVRSSAMNEDGRTTAWAGQLNTYLNVGRNELLDSIRQCRESAHSARAKAYANQHQLQVGGVAVLVQQMVESEVSGVAFSVHPVSQDSSQLVIEAGLGLGEAVVCGEITPDTFILDKPSGVVLSMSISAQTKQLVRGNNGTNTWQSVEPTMSEPKLNDEQLAELAGVVIKIEQFYGFPVDVEWAYAANQLFILQSRAITTTDTTIN